MNIENTLNRLLNLVKADLPQLEKNSILSNEDGSYSVFGQFVITPQNANECIVTKHNTLCGEFTSVKSALSWCIAEKHKQYSLSNSILLLETKRIRLLGDLNVRSGLMKKIKDSQHRSMVELKLQARKDRLKLLEDELTKCINLAKYWQIQGFNNETARTGRTTSQRTNR